MIPERNGISRLDEMMSGVAMVDMIIEWFVYGIRETVWQILNNKHRSSKQDAMNGNRNCENLLKPAWNCEITIIKPFFGGFRPFETTVYRGAINPSSPSKQRGIWFLLKKNQIFMTFQIIFGKNRIIANLLKIKNLQW